MKKIYTQKLGTLNDNIKTSVLVSTYDSISNITYKSLGSAKVSGNDIFDLGTGTRIAFDRAYIHNLKQIVKTRKNEVRALENRMKEYQAMVESLERKIEKATIDLDNLKWEQDDPTDYEDDWEDDLEDEDDWEDDPEDKDEDD